MNIGIVPAKSGSSRLPKKNFIKFWGGWNLTEIAVYRLLGSGCSYVMVSCEDWACIEELKCEFANHPEVLIHKRPDYLSKDPATIGDVVVDLFERYAENFFSREESVLVLSLPTSPFVSHSDIIDVLEIYKQFASAVHIMSVSQFETPPFNAWSNSQKSSESYFPIEHTFPSNAFKSQQSTRCPITYRSNGGVVVTSLDYFLEPSLSFKRVGYELCNEKSIDIDTEFEFDMARIFAERKFIEPWWR